MPPRKPTRDAGGAPPGKLAPGMRLSRELVAESQRERLTGAMLALVDAQGFAGTSLADLIAQAHVPRDAFYRHYGSMEDCFHAAYHGVKKREREQREAEQPWVSTPQSPERDQVESEEERGEPRDRRETPGGCGYSAPAGRANRRAGARLRTT